MDLAAVKGEFPPATSEIRAYRLGIAVLYGGDIDFAFGFKEGSDLSMVCTVRPPALTPTQQGDVFTNVGAYRLRNMRAMCNSQQSEQWANPLHFYSFPCYSLSLRRVNIRTRESA